MERVGRVTAWERADGERGHSVARVTRAPDGWTCHGTEVVAGPAAPSSCTFAIDLDDAWHTRRVAVSAFGAGVRTALLTADGEGTWTLDGEPAPALDGCLDVDIAATPLTNTFVIRRHGDLAVGVSLSLPVAWVDVPQLTVTRVEQTYTRTGPFGWGYHDAAHGGFELTVDEDGMVVDYAGFARRVWP